MDEAMDAFVERQNIVHYTALLKTETDPAKRKVVSMLLAKAVGQSGDERKIRQIDNSHAPVLAS